jgi:hypothetical protein
LKYTSEYIVTIEEYSYACFLTNDLLNFEYSSNVMMVFKRRESKGFSILLLKEYPMLVFLFLRESRKTGRDQEVDYLRFAIFIEYFDMRSYSIKQLLLIFVPKEIIAI